MSLAIFCPNNHLILSAPRCEACGWVRPPQGQPGRLAWDLPNALPGLSGFKEHSPACLAVLDGLLVAPGYYELAGFQLSDGQLRWRTALADRYRIQSLLALDGQVLGPMSFEAENILVAQQPARLVRVDPVRGEVLALWTSPGYTFNPLVASGSDLIVTTSGHDLLAMKREGLPNVRWRVDLMTYWPHSPSADDGVILLSDGKPMKEGVWLAAYDQRDGTELWRAPTDSMLAAAPQIAAGLALYRAGSGRVIARHLHTGQEAWTLDAGKIYSPLLAVDGVLYFSARGSRDPDAPDHYLIRAHDARGGQMLWQASLPGRVHHLAAAPGLILAATDNGSLVCLAVRGEKLWQLDLTTTEDPFRTGLLVADGLAILGMYSGRLTAVQVAVRAESPGDPAALMQAGKIREAADALALAGDLEHAAETYGGPLNEPARAIQLYLRAGLLQPAADLAFGRRDFQQALEIYVRTGDRAGQACCYEKIGDEIQAASIWAELGEDGRAAQLYEKVGEFIKAWDLYEKLADSAAVQRLRGKLPEDFRTLEQLEAKGFLSDAASLALRLNLYERAIKLYERTEDHERELAALKQFALRQKAEWALRRLTVLARKMGRFEDEGDAFSTLALLEQAGDAYRRAAVQAETVHADQPQEIGRLYVRAREAFEKGYCDDMAEVCRARRRFILKLPRVILEKAEGGVFREGEFNQITLVFTNLGFGIARELRIEVNTDRFEIAKESDLQANSIRPEQRVVRNLYIRPNDRQVGETVPLMLKWAWYSVDGIEREVDTLTNPVTVKRLLDTRTGEPVHITYNGPVYQGERITTYAGDHLEAGAQKGDKVVINRMGEGGGISLSSDGEEITRPLSALKREPAQAGPKCPHCGVLVKAEDEQCWACLNALV